MFERFTELAIKVVMLAQEESRRIGHAVVSTEQLLLGMVGEGKGIAAQVLSERGLKLGNLRVEVEKVFGKQQQVMSTEIPFDPHSKQVLEFSVEEAKSLGHSYIGTEHLLLGMLKHTNCGGYKLLIKLSIDPTTLRAAVIARISQGRETASVGAPSSATLPTLSEFGTNLTQSAREGKLDPVVGRYNEIERVIQILGRRQKNNPVLIGEPGVGKTAVAEGLAQRIVNNDVPDILEDKQVMTLDIGLLVAGTKYRGEFEERLKKIMEEIRSSGNVILVIDEVHTIIGAGAAEGAVDAANILKPALARGDLQCIGATTLDEYRKHIERDAALERRFQPVMVGEPSVKDTISILHGLRQRYEEHHRVKISDEALTAAATLAERYIADRFLPDKAIDLVDEGGSRVNLRRAVKSPELAAIDKQLRRIKRELDVAVRGQNFASAGQLRTQQAELEAQRAALQGAPEDTAIPVVGPEDIAEIVSSWTGVPLQKLTESEAQKLLNMENDLHQRLIGQHEAVSAVSRAIRRARVGLKNPNRPVASFIFSGPTGVGKTELTKALAAYFFGSEENMIRLDMSEYMERHTVSKLIGSPPGYVGFNEGGQLTEAVRRKPHCVILFDEIEKAHPDVFNMLLQLLEDGRLTDSKGRTVDFKNTLLIMTSNLGSKVIEKGSGGLGFDIAADEDNATYTRIKGLVMEELRHFFRPEFLNRLDDVIVFRQLTKPEIREIADILIKEVFSRLEERGIRLSTTQRFMDHLIDEGYSPTYGARPLRRAIMRMLEDTLAEEILSGNIGNNSMVEIDFVDGAVKFGPMEQAVLSEAGSSV